VKCRASEIVIFNEPKAVFFRLSYRCVGSIIVVGIDTMTADQLRKTHRASPFRPFTIHVADGRSFHIAHSEFLSQSPPGRTVIVYGNDDSFEILDLFLITRLEIHASGAPAGEPAKS